MNRTILVVEDDKNIIEGLIDILSVNGYSVVAASTKEQTLAKVSTESIDLIIMDVNLGEDNGLDICKELRKSYNMPILFLTACDSEMELIRGFQAGGDDYVTKPFRMQELIVRIQALLRRYSSVEENVIMSGDLEIALSSLTVMKARENVELTGVEYKLVLTLIKQWPNTMSRDELYYQVWDCNMDFVEANTLNVNISRIREKLGLFQGKNYIETVRGVGYRWAIPVKN